MITDFILPRLSETSATGTILKWLVQTREQVERGQPIVQVESDKAIVELEAPVSGRILSIHFQDGAVVEAGSVLAQLGPIEEPIQGRPSDPLRVEHQPGGSVRKARLPVPAPRRRVPADASTGGREPVLAGALAHAPAVEVDLPSHEVVPLSAIRARIGANLIASLRQAPHAFVETEADVTPTVEWRNAISPSEAGERPSFTAIFVRLAGRALHAFPDLNASLRGEYVYRWANINIGVAVNRQDGLIVPVIPDADKRSLEEIMGRLRSFGLSHDDPLPADAVARGTFTISNLGMYGADSVLSIIPAGQAAILSLGRVRPKPVVVSGEILVRSIVRMTLAFDHRIIDGARAAQFLGGLESLLGAPESWAT